MPLAGLEPALVGAMRSAALDPRQVLLLQLVLRAVHPWTRGAAHVSALGTCSVWAANALTVLDAHAATGQPRRPLLAKVCMQAAVAARELRAVAPQERSLRHLQVALDAAGGPGARDRASAKSLASRVRRHAEALPLTAQRLFAGAWASSVFDEAVVEAAAAETAALVLLSGRDHQDLALALQRALRRGAVDAAGIWKVLLPEPRPFLAACVVDGTRGLTGLAGLLPGAAHHDATATAGLRGRPAERLRRFAQARAPDGRPACLVVAEIDALDRSSAGWRLRRGVAELLDQYVAGHRLADLRLLPETLVAEQDGSGHAEISARGNSVRTAYPLTRDWPQPMREALRTAHLARQTDSPVARAALAWSAIESLKIVSANKAGETLVDAQELSAALALHAFRDRAMEAHQTVRQAARAELVAARQDHDSAARRLRDLERTSRGKKPPTPERAGALADAVSGARAELAGASARESELRAVLEPALAALESYVAVRPSTGLLAGTDHWVMVLSPRRRGDPPGLSAARRGLDDIAGLVGGTAERDVRALRRLFATGVGAADELDRLEARAKGMLDWLYAVRNLSLHNGVYELVGDGPVLAVGALNQLDATLEMLGNWFQHETNAPRRRPRARVASVVIRALAERKGSAADGLRSPPTRRRRLDVAELTGPQSSVWLRR